MDGHIRWVFFDFAGTLAFNDPPRVWHYLRACARRGVFLNRRDIWTALNAVWATVDSESGIAHPEASKDQASYDGFRASLEAQILEKLGVDGDREAIVRELLAIQDDPQVYTLYPEALAASARLRDSGYQLGIVSNFTWALPDLVRALGLAPYISTVITSAQVGYRKPHPKIYEAATSAMGANPKESLFVGDSFEADIAGAARYGFQTVLVDRRLTGRYQCPSIRFLTDLYQVLSIPEGP